MKFTLTREQQAVVDHRLGPALVFTVAGAGKTMAMVHRIEKLVGEKIFPPRRILATSFAQSNVQDLKVDLSKWPQMTRLSGELFHPGRR